MDYKYIGRYIKNTKHNIGFQTMHKIKVALKANFINIILIQIPIFIHHKILLYTSDILL